MPTTHHIRMYFLFEQLKRHREKKTFILSLRSKSNISVDTSRVPIVRLLLFLFLSLPPSPSSSLAVPSSVVDLIFHIDLRV